MRLKARIRRLAQKFRTHAECGQVQKMETVAKQLEALEDGQAAHIAGKVQCTSHLHICPTN